MRTGIVATLVVVGAVALAIVLANTGLVGPAPTPSPTASLAPAPTGKPVPTATGTPRPSATPVESGIRADAVVVPQRSADLAMRASGVVGAIYVHEGSLVAADQLLMKLDQSTQQAAILVAQADVNRATAALDRAQLQVDQLPPDASPGQIESAQAELHLAEAELALARTRLTEAQNALLQTEVRAPFAGTVAQISVAVGEQATAGQPVIGIGDLTAWLIETTNLSELEVVRIAVGDRATIAFDALPDLVLQGSVDRIQVRGTNADGGVMFAVVIRPDDHHPELRWNMTATVRITPSG